MTADISVDEMCFLLLSRIRNAGFAVPNIDVGAINSEYEAGLRILINRNQRHICEEEPIVHLPAAIVAPCDIRFMFEWNSGLGNLRLKPRPFMAPALYLLWDVQVFHRDNFGMAETLVRNYGFDWLDILETGQLLAQLRCSSDQPGLGSVTTNSPGLAFESSLEDNQLHTMFINQHVKARVPINREHNHHVAVCQTRFWLPNGRLYYGVIQRTP